MFENSERGYIGFRFDFTWTANDLLVFTASVMNIYNAFLAVLIRQNYEERHYEFYEKQLHEFYKYHERYIDHPIYFEFIEKWKELSRIWSKRLGPYPPPPFPFLFPFPTREAGVVLPDEYEVYQKIALYSGEYASLQIDRIIISSPGGFSFKGIGEIIKEIRELIKDLWYRNKQEKVKGELEIIEKYLRMRKDYSDINLPPPYSMPTSKLVEIVSENVTKLRELEREKKLKAIPENLDYRPEKQSSE